MLLSIAKLHELSYRFFHYNADIPKPSSETSGIEPVIQTIEADGTHRYFDMLGRPLNHRPEQGIYIDNDKKVIAK